MAENSRLNLFIVDLQTSEQFEVYGLLLNEDREVVNWQTEEDLNGKVGGGSWREFTKWHRLFGLGGGAN